MLESPELEFIMEAHNGLSAKIVQEAGKYFFSTKYPYEASANHLHELLCPENL